MKISDIGGEFALISRITGKIDDSNVVFGVGDDAAVLKLDDRKYMLLTADMLVEDDHFDLKWSTPFQIGKKAMVSNISDIAAMGGIPKYALVSASFSTDTEVEFVEELIRGMNDAGKKAGVNIIGGDTTHGKNLVINIALTGEVEKENLCLRSAANPGDIIFVTGDLGKSKAGLELLRKNIKGYVKDNLEPNHRLEQGRKLAQIGIKAMIDVSDGLASEVKHICEMSNVGAQVYKDKIPISENTRQSAKSLGKDPYDFALYGGEDFELVFTAPKEKKQEILEAVKDVTVVGEITEQDKGIWLVEKVKKKEFGSGFDHFSKDL